MLPKDGRMHFSNLKNFAKSPAHYAMSCDKESEDSVSFRIGRALHALVLEGIAPTLYEGIRRGKEWEAFKSEHEGKDILSESEFETVENCFKSIQSNPIAMDILCKAPNREKYLEWDRAGVPCAGRIDAYGDDVLVEIKTTKCADPKRFLYEAGKFGYHAQMAWYDFALGTQYHQFATPWRDHYIIAVETSAPYTCTVIKLDDLRIDQGHTLCEEWLGKYIECEETGFYPSYTTEEPVIWDAEIIIENEEEE